MSYLTNPYQVKLIELNKDLEGLKLDRSVLIYDLNEYLKYPVPTISPDLIRQQIKNIDVMIEDINYKIQTISNFIRR